MRRRLMLLLQMLQIDVLFLLPCYVSCLVYVPVYILKKNYKHTLQTKSFNSFFKRITFNIFYQIKHFALLRACLHPYFARSLSRVILQLWVGIIQCDQCHNHIFQRKCRISPALAYLHRRGSGLRPANSKTVKLLS